jgi:hypothetical protein
MSYANDLRLTVQSKPKTFPVTSPVELVESKIQLNIFTDPTLKQVYICKIYLQKHKMYR